MQKRFEPSLHVPGALILGHLGAFTANMSFKDKSLSVLVADPSSGVRPIMTSVLRELGYDKVTSVESLSEALNILAAESIDWLITSLFTDAKVNALQVLSLARKQPKLENLKISLFATEEERDFLLKAYSLGLFTSHPKPFNQESFKAEIVGVLKNLETNHWNATLTSADYLRPRLKTMDSVETLLSFEKAMNQVFPENLGVALHLAEAHFRAGNIGAARALMWQVTQRQPKLADHVAALTERHLGKQATLVGGPWKDFGLGTCVVVDPDTAIQASLRDTLVTCGAKEVQVFDHGERAWEWLKSKKEPDLLVMEWRIPGVSGPLLLQRCRSFGFHLMPVVVHSSLLQKHDEPLLREMGITEVIPKPFRRDDFMNCIAATVGQSQRPTEIRSLELKIRAHLACSELHEATNLMQLYLVKYSSPHDAIKAHLEAEFAFVAGNFKMARDMAAKSMRLGNKSVALMNLLGKALIQLREFKAALQVFKRADDIAPNSIARLCAIAETQQELGEAAAARETLGQASTLDPDNQDVINTNVNIGLAIGDVDLVKGSIDRFRPSEGVLSYLNNKAVAHARAGEYDPGIELYNNALSAIPSEKIRLRAMVGYNLALAHARKKDLPGAIKALEGLPKIYDDGLSRKSSSLLARAHAAEISGVPLQLFTDATLSSIIVEKSAEKLIRKFEPLQAKAGEACCYGLFLGQGPDSELIKALLTEMPRFHARAVIVKN